MGKFIDMIKEMAKGTKDKFANTKKEAKDMANSSISSNSNYKRKFKEGSAGTDTEQDDPLIEYKRNEPITSSKSREHEPTAVKRESRDQKIVEPDQTGTDTEEAKEEYRKQGLSESDPNDY
jgi:hypothetical protein